MLIIFSGEVNVVHYSGTIADASTASAGGTGNSLVTFSDLTFTSSPYQETSSGINISMNELANVGGGVGQYMEIQNSGGTVSYGNAPILNNTPYSDAGGGDTMDSVAVLGSSLNAGHDTAGNSFVIGGSESGRQIAGFSLGVDVSIKLIVLSVTWASGVSADSPGVLRVYQVGQEANAGTTSITIENGLITTAVDVEILAANGARTVKIDLFDPDNTSPNNTCSINGVVNLYGQPITDETQSQQTDIN